MVTSDIAYLLRIPHENAEKIKKNHGYSYTKNVDKEAFFKIESIGNRPAREIPLLKLAQYIEPRMEEILREAFMEAKKADVPLNTLQSVVLTGGAALLKGCDELAESIFNIPTRIGFPIAYKGFEDELNNPKYATAIGTLIFAMETPTKQKTIINAPGSLLSKTWKWIKNLTENVM